MVFYDWFLSCHLIFKVHVYNISIIHSIQASLFIHLFIALLGIELRTFSLSYIPGAPLFSWDRILLNCPAWAWLGNSSPVRHSLKSLHTSLSSHHSFFSMFINKSSSSYLHWSVSFFLICCSGDWIQVLTHGRQALCHWPTSLVPGSLDFRLIFSLYVVYIFHGFPLYSLYIVLYFFLLLQIKPKTWCPKVFYIPFCLNLELKQKLAKSVGEMTQVCGFFSWPLPVTKWVDGVENLRSPYALQPRCFWK